MKTEILAIILVFLVFTAPTTAVDIEKDIREMENPLAAASGKEKIGLLLRLASYTYTRAPGKCVDYCGQILEMTEHGDFPGERAAALINLSYALSVLGDREKSFEHLKEALKIYERLNDKNGAGKALNRIGYHYLSRDYPNLALEYFMRSLKVYEELGDKRTLFLPNLTLGDLYFKEENYPKSLEYYQKALDTAEENKDKPGASLCNHNIGLVYHRMGNLEKSLEYFQQALGAFEKTGNEFWIGATLTNMGRAYGDLNESSRALTCLSQAKEIFEKIGDRNELFFTLYYLGDIYLEIKNYSAALSHYEGALRIAGIQKDVSNFEKVYRGLAGVYAAKGDYKNAYNYYRKYSETRESLVNEKKNKQMAELEVQFEARQKIKEIELLKKDNKIQVLTRNAFIAGFILVSVILALLFRKFLYLFAFWKKQKYVGQYRLIETIGSGGMGTVYLAHTIRDKKQLAAVKVLRDDLVEDESARRRFKQEGNIFDKIVHPNIVTIFERGDYKGKLYIAMEYLQGKTLSQKIKEEGKIELKECLHIMIRISETLAFIHSKNIVHRDLKPANIMLVPDDPNEGKTGTVKLLDFGLALMKSQTRLTQTGILVGTIHYIAPEQIIENLYSPAGDIYALGIIFYEMLVGKPPFHQDTITAIVEKILGEPPRAPNLERLEIPEALNHLILQILSKEPDRRPSAGDVLLALKGMG